MARKYLGTDHFSSQYFDSYYFSPAISGASGEEYRISAPVRQIPVTRDGLMLEGFYNWVVNITDLQVVVGIGSPEGVLEARVPTLYMDLSGTSGNILYVKRDRDISGDRKQGWILV